MPRIKFTKAAIASLGLRADEKEQFYFDAAMPGFGIRLQGDSARWIAQYRVNRATRRVTLGRVGILDLDKARLAAKAVLAKADLGVDTQREKKDARQRATSTLGSLVKAYLDEYENLVRHNTYRSARLYLNSHWKSLHATPVSQIGHGDVAVRIAIIRKDIGNSSANHARIALSGFYGWAIENGHAHVNPVMRTRGRKSKAKKDAGKTTGRARVLSHEELVEIWKACEDDEHGKIVKLLILTLQRRGEIAGLGWSEIDTVRNKAAILPPERTKNGFEHLVPLSPAALAILETVPLRNDRDLLFGERAGPFSGFSKSKKDLDKRIVERRLEIDPDAKPMPRWTLHDLRRTGSTGMNESPPLGLGIHPHIVEAVLNHVSGHKRGVAGIYNKALYFAEKRQALDLWAEFVMRLVGQLKATPSTLKHRTEDLLQPEFAVATAV